MKPVTIVVAGIALVLPFLGGADRSARSDVKNALGETLGALTFTENKQGVQDRITTAAGRIDGGFSFAAMRSSCLAGIMTRRQEC